MAWKAPFEVSALSYGEAEAMAHDTGFFGNTGDPLLETVIDMLDELGRPDASFDVIQVGGTNGKTSTSRYTAAILGGQGLRVGLYTSPELVEMRERMEVCGAPVSREAFARGIALAAQAGRRVNARRAAAGESPYRVTEFDLLTVAALCVFAEAGIDVAVLEVGLGGRWDATTATCPVVTCVTGIGLDHTRILGDTLEAIAAEKAAIIRLGQQGCVLGVGTWAPASVEDVFLERCASEGVEPVLVRPPRASDAPGELEAGECRWHEGLACVRYELVGSPGALGEPLVLDVTGVCGRYELLRVVKPAYQAANVACALAVAERYLGRSPEAGSLRASVEACPTPGRFDLLRREPVQIIDAAHNPQSIRALLASLAETQPDVGARPALLAAVLADKDVEGIVGLLAPEFDRVYVTATSSPRALSPQELADVFRAHGMEPAAVFDDVPQACGALAREAYLACGSITLAGEVAAWHRR